MSDKGGFYYYEEKTALLVRRELLRITGIIQTVLELGKLDGDYAKALVNLLWKDGTPIRKEIEIGDLEQEKLTIIEKLFFMKICIN